MEVAKKLLAENLPGVALERLKKILYSDSCVDEWKVHELICEAFHDLCDAEGAVQASLSAAETDKILRSQRIHFSNYLFTLHYLPDVDARILFDAAKVYNSLYRDVDTFTPLPRSSNKIHVAFIAPHFNESSAARFYEKILTDYDREKFFVTAWSLSDDEDDFTKKIRANVDAYFNVAEKSFEESAQLIHSNGADILFDLGGHTEGGLTLQIAAYKPARIQISGIGYFDTTGLDAVDFYLTDKFLVRNENFFTEKILTLENIFAFTPSEKMISAKKILKRASHGLTFACLNNFMKITDEYLNCVRIILDELPSAEMIFRDTTPLESRRLAMTEKVELAGLPIERVKILRGSDNYLDDYPKIDLVLDTFPYTGGMMTATALYMGVPVLNLCGKLHAQRLGADILKTAGLENFIVDNTDDYINFAINFKRGENFSIDKLLDTKTLVKNFYAKLEEVMTLA